MPKWTVEVVKGMSKSEFWEVHAETYQEAEVKAYSLRGQEGLPLGTILIREGEEKKFRRIKDVVLKSDIYR